MIMANMSLTKNPMPSQDPNVRNKNFDEVALGYTEEQALDEAQRCLGCKNKPCMTGCPVMVHIPEFIAEVAKGHFEEAYQIISNTSALPAVCGRVCPQESQCEKYCVRGKKGEPVAIGRLERFVADWHNSHTCDLPPRPQPNGHKVAVVGSGPAGLTCAGDLARKGYDVTVFEALHLAGGVLVYGIPEFRLPKAIVQKEVDGLKEMGVPIATDTVIGRTISIDELMEEHGFEAVFIGSGAGLPMFMDIPGVNYRGVYSANEFLTRINLMKAYLPDSDTPIQHPKRVAVVGGGNVAMEDARCGKPSTGHQLGPSAWGRGCTSSTAAAWRSSPPVKKRWSTLRKRVSSSRPSTTLWRSLLTRTTTSTRSAASGWSWASPMPPAAAVRWRSPAASSISTWTASSWPWAPAPTP